MNWKRIFRLLFRWLTFRARYELFPLTSDSPWQGVVFQLHTRNGIRKKLRTLICSKCEEDFDKQGWCSCSCEWGVKDYYLDRFGFC
jgi:hypothetical protein